MGGCTQPTSEDEFECVECEVNDPPQRQRDAADETSSSWTEPVFYLEIPWAEVYHA